MDDARKDNVTLEERVDSLESEVAELRRQMGQKRVKRDWRAWYGTAKDDPGYDEMVRLGREYRESLRERYDDDNPNAGS